MCAQQRNELRVGRFLEWIERHKSAGRSYGLCQAALGLMARRLASQQGHRPGPKLLAPLDHPFLKQRRFAHVKLPQKVAAIQVAQGFAVALAHERKGVDPDWIVGVERHGFAPDDETAVQTGVAQFQDDIPQAGPGLGVGRFAPQQPRQPMTRVRPRFEGEIYQQGLGLGRELGQRLTVQGQLKGSEDGDTQHDQAARGQNTSMARLKICAGRGRRRKLTME